MKKILFLAASLSLFPAAASADPLILLNGENITGMRNQTFQNVSVTFDEHGNLFINAPQYKIMAEPKTAANAPAVIVNTPAAAAPAPNGNGDTVKIPNSAVPTYLIASFNQPGLLGANIDLFINGQFVKTITQGQPQQAVDVTKYLTKGRNSVQYKTHMAADSGTSSKAEAAISFAKLTSKQGSAVELSGAYGNLIIKSTDSERLFSQDIILE